MVDLFVLFLKSPGIARGFCLEVKEKWGNWQGGECFRVIGFIFESFEDQIKQTIS
jgi:hypothetical protein